MKPRENIFRNAFVDELRATVNRGERLEEYYKPTIEYESSVLWPLRVEVNGDTPSLSPDKNNDPENACMLYNYLMNLDETQASDKRLWTYMAHKPFRGYVQARWPLPYTLEEVERSHEARVKTSNSILLHWFINSTDSRALKRHALARLWWAAHLTYAPWKDDNEFKSLENNDEYVYTKFLLSNETLYTDVVERVLGSSRPTLIAILEYFIKNPEAVNRNNLRPIMKELNLISGVKKLSTLTFSEIYEIVAKVSSEIIATNKQR